MSSDPKPAAPPNVASCELTEGQRLGKYAITRRLGAGGMGTVFLAEDVELKRTVALKVLPKDRADNPTLVKRFNAEGQAAAQLHHENIVQVYDAGEIDGYLFLALEYVDGIDLLAWLRKRGPIPVKRSIAIIRQVAAALQHAYERNIVHRDIKPSNLMVKADGTVKLTDMGLARSVDESMDTSITRAGTTVGTIDYMAPEQARNSKAADIRSDIYSLGCTWYHMLAGQAPFPEGSITNKVQSHFSAPRPDPRDRNPRIPAAVVAVMHRMMARLPEERYRNPAELLQDLSAESLMRADMKPDLLAALSDEASGGRRAPDSTEAAEDESDWETVFRRVRESQEEDQQEAYEFDESSGRGNRDSSPQTREVATIESPPPKQRAPGKKQRQKPARHEPVERAPLPNDTVPKQEEPVPAKLKKRKKQVSPAGEKAQDGSTRSKAKKVAKAVQQFGGKAMPAAMKKPEAGLPGGPSNEIDIDFVKIGVVLVAVSAAVAGIWWAAHRFGQQAAGLDGSLKNPYGSNAEGGELQQGAAVAPREPGAPDGQADQGDNTSGETGPGDSAALGGDQEGPSNQLSAQSGGSDQRILLPEWARNGWNPPATAHKPLRLLVQRGASGASESISFSEAVKHLAPEGGVIEFSGTGPYYVKPAVLKGIERLELKGHQGTQPILVVQEQDLGKSESWLNVTDTRLLLDGVHLVFMRRGPAPDQAATLITLESSDLLMRRSSITAVGDPGPLICIRSAGKSKAGNRILIEGSSLRGASLTAVEAAGAGSDVVFNNSLVITEERSAIHVQSRSGDRSSEHKVLVSRSTLLCGSYGITIANQTPKAVPIPVDLRLVQTELVHSARMQNRAALRMDAWPVNQSTDLDAPRPAACRLRSDRVRMSGWPRLVDFAGSGGERVDVLDSATWMQFWKETLPSESVTGAEGGPFTAGPSVQNRPGSEVRSWLTGRSSDEEETKHRLGVDLAGLAILDGPWETRVLATALRRIGPVPLEFNKETVPFDLRRGGSFQEFLNGPQCPDGTHVVCRGAGLKQIDPVIVTGKSLKIEFQQTDGAPLDVQPTPQTDAQALLTVRGGSLELVNAPLSIPESKRRRYPKTMIRVEGGRLRLTNCRLTGAPDAGNSPVIEWSGTAEGSSWGWAANTVFIGHGDVLAGDLSSSMLYFDNCLVVTGRNGFRLRTGESPGELLLNHCTLSAAAAVLTGAESANSAGMNVFVRETVFAAPPNSEAMQQPAVIDVRSSVVSQIQWWETGCGYAPEVAILNRQMPQVRQISTEWPAMWGGEAHVLDQLSGPGSVLLRGVVGNLDQIDPNEFALQQGCKGASWGESGDPIGVRVENLGPLEATQSPPEATPDKKPAQPAASPNNPGF